MGAQPHLRHVYLTIVAALFALLGACDDDETQAADAGEVVTIVTLDGVDSSTLTDREAKLWSGYVTKLMAPCPDVAVSVAQCIEEKRSCDTCVPAAEFLMAKARAGLPREDVTELYANRFDPGRVKKIDVGDSPTMGAKDGAVTLVEFADFECGGCRDFFMMLQPLKKKFSKDLRIVFKNFPLSFHAHAKLASQAAVAAHKQGQFWRMHDLMFSNQTALTEADLIRYAESSGLDVGQFKRDLHSSETKGLVERDVQQAKDLGITGTPALFLNGRSCGNVTLEDLEVWIQQEIDAAKSKNGKSTKTENPKKPAPSATPSASP